MRVGCDGGWRGALGALGALLGLGGCQFTGPSTEGTAFQCEVGARCPPGYACVAGVCRSSDRPDAGGGVADAGDAPDAGRTPADASLADAPRESDAARPTDGRPPVDASPPVDAAPVIVVFGDGDGADIRGVTTDTWLDSSNPNTAHGASPELQIDTAPSQVMLIRFDLDAIPAGAVIDRADLVVRVFDPGAPGDRLRARVLLRPWTERDATWDTANGRDRWPSPGAGGAALGDQAGSVVADASGERSMSIDTDVVQAWVDDPGNNDGLRLEASSTDDIRVNSREAGTASRPYLRVAYH